MSKTKAQLTLENALLRNELTALRANTPRYNYRTYIDYKVESSLQKIDDYEYTIYNVYQNTPIDSFVETVTDRPYRVGSCYYELTKKEKIQSDKNICIQNTYNGKLFSGRAARTLLGLPNFDVTVEPRLIDGYRVFVQSNSHNRKLIRGQRLVVFH